MSQLLPQPPLPPATLRPYARQEAAPHSARQHLVAGGSVGLIALTFVEAIHRLGARAVATVQVGLSLDQWLALIVVVVGFVYLEGYRALQGKFAPLVVSRALEIGSRKPGIGTLLSAPFYSLSLVGAPRCTLVRAWLGVGLIVGAVLLVRALPSPWRGIVDAGVAAALAWGLCALIVELWRRTRG